MIAVAEERPLLTCFSLILLLAAFLLVLVSLIRWVEQVTEAVDNGWWNKVTVLVAVPPMVWLFPSRVSAGRPTPVPRHEPVRGFGGASGKPRARDDVVAPAARVAREGGPAGAGAPAADAPVSADQPPPGTPKEYLGMPVIPPKPKVARSPSVDPDKVERLRQKMREQGMLPPEDE